MLDNCARSFDEIIRPTAPKQEFQTPSSVGFTFDHQQPEEHFKVDPPTKIGRSGQYRRDVG